MNAMCLHVLNVFHTFAAEHGRLFKKQARQKPMVHSRYSVFHQHLDVDGTCYAASSPQQRNDVYEE